MNGSRNEFFSCTSISINEHSRVCRSDRLHLLQHTAQRCAFADDWREIHFAADFIFEIELFLGQLLFQLSNFPKGTRILYGNGNLICDLGQKLDIVAGERSVLIFDHTKYPQNATSACAVSFMPSRFPSWTLPHQGLPVRKTAPEISSSMGTRLSSWTDSPLKGKSRA